MSRTYEELLSAQIELMHFNKNHDPRNGQFSEGHGGPSTKSGNKNEKPSESMDKDIVVKGIRLSESQKKTLKIGAIAAIASIAIIGGIVLSKSGKFDNAINIGKKRSSEKQ